MLAWYAVHRSILILEFSIGKLEIHTYKQITLAVLCFFLSNSLIHKKVDFGTTHWNIFLI